MVQAGQHHHRAVLKQSNKPFKSKHASKGSLKSAAKGKTVSEKSSHRKITVSSKKARLNANAQKREVKRQHVVEDVKFFSTSSGGGNVPRIISVVPLLPSLSPRRFLSTLIPSLGLDEQELESAVDTLQGDQGTLLLRAPRFKTSVQVNVLPPLSVYQTLDAALVSDYVVLLLSSVDEVQLEGEAVLRCLQGQTGGVEIVAAVQAPEDRPIVPSTKQLIHKSLLSFARYFFPSIAKIHSSDSSNDAALLARALCEAAPKTDRKGDSRAYVVAEGSGAVRWSAGQGSSSGRLQVEGTVRGGCLSANRLVHIPGAGDFQVESICQASPSSLGRVQRPRIDAMQLDGASAPLSVPDEGADDLTATNAVDPLANDQTWPTEEEMQGAEEMLREGPRRTKKVPKGTSAYQAAWIIDDEDEDQDDDEDEEDEDEEEMEIEGDDADSVPDLVPADEETEEIDVTEDADADELDPEEEEREYEAYMRRREKAQAEDMAFPDEIDTPRHIPARTRFQRYRGLKSFRTSPWDPYENLPEDYAKIFQFENFASTSKRIENEARTEGVKPGTRVIVTIQGVPESVYRQHDPRTPFIIHGLLQHEHKRTVSHLVVQRNTEYTEPVKAKDPLVLCLGPRRYTVNPIYSQHVKGGGKGVNNVHKSEKFLRPGAAAVATFYGPVCFGKVPCLLLKDEGQGKVPSLVAMGSTLPPDPTRINAKRLILTGHPLKIHKQTATIRYMFFNREDVEYFQSVELHTKFGRIGHITEALGTHGYFKAHFDGPIGQMDTICMSLYKRQYPKWSEDYHPRAGLKAIDQGGDEAMEE